MGPWLFRRLGVGTAFSSLRRSSSTTIAWRRRRRRRVDHRSVGNRRHLAATGEEARHGIHTTTTTTTRVGAFDSLRGLSLSSTPHFSIPVSPDGVHILSEPCEFYDALLTGIASARREITLASLYLGTGDMEGRLVAALASACANTPELRVHILLDHSRATRRGSGDGNDSVGMFRTLQECYPGRVRLSLFRMPQLCGGAVASRLRSPLNEVYAVQHLKAYVFDSDVLMTGANLSHDYFTLRQDRYVLFRGAAELADHYRAIVDTLSAFSYSGQSLLPPRNLPLPIAASANADNAAAAVGEDDLRGMLVELQIRGSNAIVGQVKSGEKGGHGRRRRLSTNGKEIAPRCSTTASAASTSPPDTWVIPTLQMAPLGIRQDEELTLAVFASATDLRLATAYFNPPRELTSCLGRVAQVTLLTASLETHGFADATGLFKSWIPSAYQHYMQQFLRNHKSNAGEGGKMAAHEFARPNWTFHGKGAWCFSRASDEGGAASATAKEEESCVSFVGSSNFGMRSRDRDLESQVMLVTENVSLVQRLKAEHDTLMSHARPIAAGVGGGASGGNDYIGWARVLGNAGRRFL